MKDSEILRKARDLIDTPGKWLKGRLRDHCGSFCSIGAIQASGDYRSHPEHDGATVCEVLLKDQIPQTFCGLHPDFLRPVARWNDAPETTHADVMAAFGRAIDLAEAHEASQSHSPQASEVKV